MRRDRAQIGLLQVLLVFGEAADCVAFMHQRLQQRGLRVQVAAEVEFGMALCRIL
jgi:hypothetical protein